MASEPVNDDVLWEIFRLLPAKTILRFRSVSRSWDALLSGTLFRRSLPATTIAGFFLPIYEFSLPPVYTYFPLGDSSPTRRHRIAGATIAATCNGLLLLNGIYRRDFHLWNPATDAYVTIPEFPKATHERHRYLATGLVYDPRISPHYKVVRISHEVGGWPALRCHVFSSIDGGGKWVDSAATIELYGASATEANGPLACAGSMVAVRIGGRRDPVIVVVDVEQRKMWGFRLDGMPSYDQFKGGESCFSYLHAYCGCIYLFMGNAFGFVVLDLVKDFTNGEVKWELKYSSRFGEASREMPSRVVVDGDKLPFFFSGGGVRSTVDVSEVLEKFASWWQVRWSKLDLVPFYPCLLDPVGAARRTSTDIPWIEPLEMS